MGMTEINALTVRQWLPDWDDVKFEPALRRRRPPDHFLLLAMNVGTLRRLTGIARRSTAGPLRRSQDDAIQRRHSPERSEEIRRFVRHGYPWSTLSQTRRDSGEYDDLKMPGWLPTAVIVNIIPEGESRGGSAVASQDVIGVTQDASGAVITLPDGSDSKGWTPAERSPIEIIDGQHRLWAFNDDDESDFELPVVAFVGLDISWQAYVFWTVNIKPKRINASLAFDLYPLLRTADWLEKAEGLAVYREARAQELTELLWALEESPWYQRINMLGEGRWGVSQAAWIRSLLATFIKANRVSSEGTIGGLFGQEVEATGLALPWSRPQQAAFLITAWRLFAQSLQKTNEEWAQQLRADEETSSSESNPNPLGLDASLVNRYSLLSTDQGVRGVLYMLNDLCFVEADRLGLQEWVDDEYQGSDDASEVRDALKSLKSQEVSTFLAELVDALATFDWRTSSYPELSEALKFEKSAYRGSGGYRLLRESLLKHLSRAESPGVSSAAKKAAGRLLGSD